MIHVCFLYSNNNMVTVYSSLTCLSVHKAYIPTRDGYQLAVIILTWYSSTHSVHQLDAVIGAGVHIQEIDAPALYVSPH